jgi:hypothetical protein
MFESLKKIFNPSKPSIDTPRSEWPNRTSYIVKECSKLTPFLTEAWFPIISNFDIFSVYKDSKIIQMNQKSLDALLAFQTSCALSMIGTTEYVSSSEGHDFADYFCSKMYRGERHADCIYLPAFLGTDQGEELFKKFSVLFSAALFPEAETLQLIAQPIINLAGQDMQFLTCRVVAEAFDDKMNADSISSQRKEFFNRIKKK